MMSRDKEYTDNVTITVLISLTDRTTMTGNIQRPRTRTLVEYLNNST